MCFDIKENLKAGVHFARAVIPFYWQYITAFFFSGRQRHIQKMFVHCLLLTLKVGWPGCNNETSLLVGQHRSELIVQEELLEGFKVWLHPPTSYRNCRGLNALHYISVLLVQAGLVGHTPH